MHFNWSLGPFSPHSKDVTDMGGTQKPEGGTSTKGGPSVESGPSAAPQPNFLNRMREMGIVC
jgi:hypothetical protein